MAEKIYQDFTISAEGITGHSSIPKKENAIYLLAEAMTALEKYRPVPTLIPATRSFFKERAKLEEPQLAKAMTAVVDSQKAIPGWALSEIEKNPIIAFQLYTSCVETMVSGGTKENVLAAKAQANVNCRILPSESVEDVHERLVRIIKNPKVKIELAKAMLAAGASPVENEVMTAVKTAGHEFWPNALVIPALSLGASDSRYLRARRVAAYGVSCFALTEDDSSRAHGIDKRLPLASIEPGLRYINRIVSLLVR